MRKPLIFAAAVTIVICSAGIAQATPVDLYDNGAAITPPSGPLLNDIIFAGYAVSDSFTLTANGTAETVDFTISVPRNGQNISGIDWEIGTSGFSAIAGDSGILTPVTELSSSTWGSGRTKTDIYTDSFTLPDIALSAGQTYWLTLSAPSLEQISWDISGGSSQSDSASYVLGFVGPTTQDLSSNSFSIWGDRDPDPVPEPSSALLMASGLLIGFSGFAFLSRRKHA